jgi:hypothetical protein
LNVREYRDVAHKLANRRMKGTPEGDLKRAVVQQLCLMPGVDVISMNTGALKGIGQGGNERLIRFGFPGMADLFVRVSVGTKCVPRYAVLWIELKTPGKKQSDAQVCFEGQAAKWGDHYRVVRSIEEAELAVREVRG